MKINCLEIFFWATEKIKRSIQEAEKETVLFWGRGVDPQPPEAPSLISRDSVCWESRNCLPRL